MGFWSSLFGPPSRDKFARMFMHGVRAAGEQKPVSYDREQFSVVGEDGQVAFLGNAYHEYCSVPKAQRAHVLQVSVRGWFARLQELPSKFEDVHPDLLPALRARSYIELTRLRTQVEGDNTMEWPYQVLGEHFGLALIYDLPDSMRSITQGDLDAWGVTFYEAMEAARHNLSGLQMAFVGPKEGEGVYLSAAGDSHDASRLILLNLIRQLQVKGDHIAMVPNRNCLIVGGSEDPGSLKAMLALAEEALKEARPISGITLKLEGDDWIPWLPDQSHPLYGEFKTLQVQWLGQDYHEQKELLDKLHEKTGEDVFVASFSGFQEEGSGLPTTYCVWTDGVPTYLPRTDKIAFISEGQDPVLVDWSRTVDVIGDLMEPLDMYPVRYKVREYPTPEQLTAMAQR